MQPDCAGKGHDERLRALSKAKFQQKPARAPQFFYPQRPHAKDNNLKVKEKPVRNAGIPLRTASKPPGSTRQAPTPRATFVRQQPRYAARQAQRTRVGARAPQAGPRGLINLGNTCYLNAVLQCLFALPELATALDQAKAAVGEWLTENGVVMALSKCLDDWRSVSAGGSSQYSPDLLKAAVDRYTPMFEGTFQHDAHEFFVKLMAAITEEVGGIEAQLQASGIPINVTADPGKHVFGMKIHTKYTCECGAESSGRQLEIYMDVSLALNAGASGAQPLNLQSMLTSFLHEEIEKNCDTCGKYAAQHTVSKGIILLPRVFVVHLKRFQTNTSGLQALKVHDPVVVPLVLDLQPHCSNEYCLPGGVTHREDAALRYQLTAAISHHGATSTEGHFTADTRDVTTGEWFRTDDGRVSRIQARDVISRDREIYMLFYTLPS